MTFSCRSLAQSGCGMFQPIKIPTASTNNVYISALPNRITRFSSCLRRNLTKTPTTDSRCSLRSCHLAATLPPYCRCAQTAFPPRQHDMPPGRFTERYPRRSTPSGVVGLVLDSQISEAVWDLNHMQQKQIPLMRLSFSNFSDSLLIAGRSGVLLPVPSAGKITRGRTCKA